MDGCVATLDVGKTNLKLVVFDAGGRMLAERSRRNAPLPPDAAHRYLQLDTELAWRFFLEALREFSPVYAIRTLSISTHGAAGALASDSGLALPPMDYEFEGLGEDFAAYEALRPPFAETQSPSLTRGLNLGRQFFHLFRRYPAEAARAQAILAYPQYWAWRLSGVFASEVTSLGSHSDLWNPGERRLSSLVARLGWGALFPPLRNAWDALGPIRPEVAAATGLDPATRVLCGVHDSNASLVPHLLGREGAFTVISTGTWVIIFAVDARAALDPKADMLANVDVRGRPIPCARFMGGREFAILAGEAPPSVGEADVAAVVANGAMALPAFSDQGGPFADRAGRIEGELPDRPAARAALATLYCALMTDYLIERLDAAAPLIVDGGFARSAAFPALLQALRPGRPTAIAGASAGAAEGAAMLARWGEAPSPARLEGAEAWTLPGLVAYRARWRERIGG